MCIIKRIIFKILMTLSVCLRPLRHNLYMRVVQKAYEFQGVKFIGHASYIDYRSYIDNSRNIILGRDVVISINAIILGHDWSPNIIRKVSHTDDINPCKLAEVSIGDNSFVGAGAIILPGTKIGKSCIIGAGAVVKGAIPDFSIVIGNPCKILKKITPHL